MFAAWFKPRPAAVRAAQTAIFDALVAGLRAGSHTALDAALWPVAASDAGGITAGGIAAGIAGADPATRAYNLGYALAQWLTETVAARTADLERALQEQRETSAHLERVIAVIQQDPLLAQVERLRQAEAQAQTAARAAAQRIAQAEAALSRAQAAHTADVTRLEQELAAYQRLVVRLQTGRAEPT